MNRNRRMKTSTTILAAKDLLEYNGWTQGSYLANDGFSMCVSMALLSASTEFESFCRAAAYVEDQYPEHWTLAQWNDAPNTTWEDVAWKLKAAAEQAEEEERAYEETYWNM